MLIAEYWFEVLVDKIISMEKGPLTDRLPEIFSVENISDSWEGRTRQCRGPCSGKNILAKMIARMF